MESNDTQKKLDAAYARLEAGESPECIGADFPELKNEIFDFAKTIKGIRRLGAGASPDKALLRNMLSTLPVTEPAGERFSLRDVEQKKGRSVFSNSLFQIHTIMNTQMKVIVPIAALLVVGGAVFFMNRGIPRDEVAFETQKTAEESSQAENTTTGTQETMMKSAAQSEIATGDIDATVALIIQSATEEAAIADEDKGDADFATYDASVVTEFGQSFNDF